MSCARSIITKIRPEKRINAVLDDHGLVGEQLRLGND